MPQQRPHAPLPHPQDLISGPANHATYGYWAVESITGTGQVHATDAWADAPSENGPHCVDSWTLAPVRVPVAGLTPYPSDVAGQPDWSAQVRWLAHGWGRGARPGLARALWGCSRQVH